MAFIDFKDLTEFNEEHKRKGQRALSLNLGERFFGVLYLSPNYYTLAWNGYISFSNLDKEVRSSLPTHLEIPTLLNFPRPVWRFTTINVSLIWASENGESDDLLKYSLEDEQQFYEYRKVLDSSRISFARYDFHFLHNRKLLPSLCSFTAENPELVPMNDCELTIKLPVNVQLTPNLLSWVFSRSLWLRRGGHFNNQELIDYSSQLSGFVRNHVK
jgi:hypothetical protein